MSCLVSELKSLSRLVIFKDVSRLFSDISFKLSFLDVIREFLFVLNSMTFDFVKLNLISWDSLRVLSAVFSFFKWKMGFSVCYIPIS